MPAQGLARHSFYKQLIPFLRLLRGSCIEIPRPPPEERFLLHIRLVVSSPHSSLHAQTAFARASRRCLPAPPVTKPCRSFHAATFRSPEFRASTGQTLQQ